MRSLPQSTAQPRLALYLRPRHALSFSKPQASSSPAPPTAKVQLTAGALHLFRTLRTVQALCRSLQHSSHQPATQGTPAWEASINERL